MRFIPLFKLPQTEYFMVTWESRKNKKKKFSRPAAIQKYATAAAAP